MKVRFHPEALAELGDAALFYERCKTGLGERFLNSVEAALQSIQATPTRWPVLEQDIRRRLVRVFPYAILYTCEPRFLLIIAIMHAHQQPSYWRSRTSN